MIPTSIELALFLRDDYVQIFLFGKFTANNVDAASKFDSNNEHIKEDIAREVNTASIAKSERTIFSSPISLQIADFLKCPTQKSN